MTGPWIFNIRVLIIYLLQPHELITAQAALRYACRPTPRRTPKLDRTCIIGTHPDNEVRTNVCRENRRDTNRESIAGSSEPASSRESSLATLRKIFIGVATIIAKAVHLAMSNCLQVFACYYYLVWGVVRVEAVPDSKIDGGILISDSHSAKGPVHGTSKLSGTGSGRLFVALILIALGAAVLYVLLDLTIAIATSPKGAAGWRFEAKLWYNCKAALRAVTFTLFSAFGFYMGGAGFAEAFQAAALAASERDFAYEGGPRPFKIFSCAVMGARISRRIRSGVPKRNVRCVDYEGNLIFELEADPVATIISEVAPSIQGPCARALGQRTRSSWLAFSKLIFGEVAASLLEPYLSSGDVPEAPSAFRLTLVESGEARQPRTKVIIHGYGSYGDVAPLNTWRQAFERAGFECSVALDFTVEEGTAHLHEIERGNPARAIAACIQASLKRLNEREELSYHLHPASNLVSDTAGITYGLDPDPKLVEPIILGHEIADGVNKVFSGTNRNYIQVGLPFGLPRPSPYGFMKRLFFRPRWRYKEASVPSSSLCSIPVEPALQRGDYRKSFSRVRRIHCHGGAGTVAMACSQFCNFESHSAILDRRWTTDDYRCLDLSGGPVLTIARAAIQNPGVLLDAELSRTASLACCLSFCEGVGSLMSERAAEIKDLCMNLYASTPKREIAQLAVSLGENGSLILLTVPGLWCLAQKLLLRRATALRYTPRVVLATEMMQMVARSRACTSSVANAYAEFVSAVTTSGLRVGFRRVHSCYLGFHVALIENGVEHGATEVSGSCVVYTSEETSFEFYVGIQTTKDLLKEGDRLGNYGPVHNCATYLYSRIGRPGGRVAITLISLNVGMAFGALWPIPVIHALGLEDHAQRLMAAFRFALTNERLFGLLHNFGYEGPDDLEAIRISEAVEPKPPKFLGLSGEFKGRIAFLLGSKLDATRRNQILCCLKFRSCEEPVYACDCWKCTTLQARHIDYPLLYEILVAQLTWVSVSDPDDPDIMDFLVGLAIIYDLTITTTRIWGGKDGRRQFGSGATMIVVDSLHTPIHEMPQERPYQGPRIAAQLVRPRFEQAFRHMLTRCITYLGYRLRDVEFLFDVGAAAFGPETIIGKPAAWVMNIPGTKPFPVTREEYVMADMFQLVDEIGGEATRRYLRLLNEKRPAGQPALEEILARRPIRRPSPDGYFEGRAARALALGAEQGANYLDWASPEKIAESLGRYATVDGSTPPPLAAIYEAIDELQKISLHVFDSNFVVRPETIARQLVFKYSCGWPFEGQKIVIDNQEVVARYRRQIRRAGWLDTVFALVRDRFRTGQIPTCHHHSFVKCYIERLSKLEAGAPIRTVVSQSLVDYFCDMALQYDQNKRICQNPYELPWTIGMTMNGAGYNRKLETLPKRDYWAEVDASQFDSTMPTWVLGALARLRAKGFVGHSQFDQIEQALRVQYLALEKGHIHELHTGHTFLKQRGGSTGSASTTANNTIAMQLVLRIAAGEALEMDQNKVSARLTVMNSGDDAILGWDGPPTLVEDIKKILEGYGIVLKVGRVQKDTFVGMEYCRKLIRPGGEFADEFQSHGIMRPQYAIVHDSATILMRQTAMMHFNDAGYQWLRTIGHALLCAHNRPTYNFLEGEAKRLRAILAKNPAGRRLISRAKFPSYHMVMRTSYKDIDDRFRKFFALDSFEGWIRFESSWVGAIMDFAHGLDQLGLKFLAGERPTAGSNDVMVPLTGLTAEAIRCVGGPCATKVEFARKVSAGPYACCIDVEREWNWLETHRPALMNDEATSILALTAILTLFSASAHKWLARTPVLASILNGWVASNLIGQSFYGATSAICYAARGAVDPSLSGVVPKNPWIYQVRAAYMLSDILAPLAVCTTHVTSRAVRAIDTAARTVANYLIAPRIWDCPSVTRGHILHRKWENFYEQKVHPFRKAPLIVKAATGTGKTRFLPLMARGVNFIIIASPRRILAKNSDFEYISKGDIISGRFNAMTHGHALARYGSRLELLPADHLLMIDEAHDESAETIRLLFAARNRPLTIAMTATPGTLACRGWGDVPVAEYEGERPFRSVIESRVGDDFVTTIVKAAKASKGRVLAIHPRRNTVEQAVEMLIANGIQAAVLARDMAIPEARVIVATQVADAGINIRGVDIVVDSGLQMFKHEDQLYIGPESEACAEQRAGRTGRFCDGLVIRLREPVSRACTPFPTTDGYIEDEKAWNEILGIQPAAKSGGSIWWPAVESLPGTNLRRSHIATLLRFALRFDNSKECLARRHEAVDDDAHGDLFNRSEWLRHMAADTDVLDRLFELKPFETPFGRVRWISLTKDGLAYDEPLRGLRAVPDDVDAIPAFGFTHRVSGVPAPVRGAGKAASWKRLVEIFMCAAGRDVEEIAHVGRSTSEVGSSYLEQRLTSLATHLDIHFYWCQEQGYPARCIGNMATYPSSIALVVGLVSFEVYKWETRLRRAPYYRPQKHTAQMTGGGIQLSFVVSDDRVDRNIQYVFEEHEEFDTSSFDLGWVTQETDNGSCLYSAVSIATRSPSLGRGPCTLETMRSLLTTHRLNAVISGYPTAIIDEDPRLGLPQIWVHVESGTQHARPLGRLRSALQSGSIRAIEVKRPYEVCQLRRAIPAYCSDIRRDTSPFLASPQNIGLRTPNYDARRICHILSRDGAGKECPSPCTDPTRFRHLATWLRVNVHVHDHEKETSTCYHPCGLSGYAPYHRWGYNVHIHRFGIDAYSLEHSSRAKEGQPNFRVFDRLAFLTPSVALDNELFETRSEDRKKPDVDERYPEIHEWLRSSNRAHVFATSDSAKSKAPTPTWKRRRGNWSVKSVAARLCAEILQEAFGESGDVRRVTSRLNGRVRKYLATYCRPESFSDEPRECEAIAQAFVDAEIWPRSYLALQGSTDTNAKLTSRKDYELTVWLPSGKRADRWPENRVNRYGFIEEDGVGLRAVAGEIFVAKGTYVENHDTKYDVSTPPMTEATSGRIDGIGRPRLWTPLLTRAEVDKVFETEGETVTATCRNLACTLKIVRNGRVTTTYPDRIVARVTPMAGRETWLFRFGDLYRIGLYAFESTQEFEFGRRCHYQDNPDKIWLLSEYERVITRGSSEEIKRLTEIHGQTWSDGLRDAVLHYMAKHPRIASTTQARASFLKPFSSVFGSEDFVFRVTRQTTNRTAAVRNASIAGGIGAIAAGAAAAIVWPLGLIWTAVAATTIAGTTAYISTGRTTTTVDERPAVTEFDAENRRLTTRCAVFEPTVLIPTEKLLK